MERSRSSQAASWARVGVIGFVTAYLLGFVLPGFRHPGVLLIAPAAAVGMYEWARIQWSARELVLLVAVVIVVGLSLVSPTYLGR